MNADRLHAWPKPLPKSSSTGPSPSCIGAHLRDVYSYAYYRIGNHHDAEDITEQTFLQAYRHFERAQRESRAARSGPGSSGSPTTWPPTTTATARAGPRRSSRTRRSSPRLHDTEDLVESREEVQEVLAGVANLPDDRREALIMRFALDMDNREIARALGRSEGATKVLIHRAIKQLGEELEGEGDDRRRATTALGARRSSRPSTWASAWSPPHRDRRRRGRGARRLGALGDARPAQLGPARRGRGRGRGRRRRPPPHPGRRQQKQRSGASAGARSLERSARATWRPRRATRTTRAARRTGWRTRGPRGPSSFPGYAALLRPCSAPARGRVGPRPAMPISGGGCCPPC